MNLQEILREIKGVITAAEPSAKVILYGSQARGDSRPDSDIDILIFLPDTYKGSAFVKKRSEISGRLYDLSLDNAVDISPLVTIPEYFYARKTPFTVNIANEGIEL